MLQKYNLLHRYLLNTKPFVEVNRPVYLRAPNFVIAMHADGQAPNGAKPSAGTALTTKLYVFLWLSTIMVMIFFFFFFFFGGGAMFAEISRYIYAFTHIPVILSIVFSNVTKILSRWRNCGHWLHQKLSKLQVPPVKKISSNDDNSVLVLGWQQHYNDVIMGVIASQITSLTIVYSTVYSDADQRKHQSSASLAFVRGLHRGPENSPHKWPVTRKMFPFDDVIMKWPKHYIFIVCVANPRPNHQNAEKIRPYDSSNKKQSNGSVS